VDKKECLLCAKVKSLTSIARECWEGVWECDNKLLLSCFVCFFRVKVVEGMNTRIETLYVKHDMMDGWIDGVLVEKAGKKWWIVLTSKEKMPPNQSASHSFCVLLARSHPRAQSHR
jgi:hypothetical protein